MKNLPFRFSKEEIQIRRGRIRAAMSGAGVDALIIGSSARSDRRGALRYATDTCLQFFEEFAVIHLEGPVGYFAHDAARAAFAQNLHLVDYADFIDPAAPGRKAARFAKGRRPGRIGVCGADSLSMKYCASLMEALEGEDVADFTRNLDMVRMGKSAAEIAFSRRAVALNEEAFMAWLASVKAGEDRYKPFAAASALAAEMGCEEQFWLASFGKEPPLCLPQALAGGGAWERGESGVVVLEHTVYGGYFGEVMHTYFLGSPESGAVEAFQAVSRAQQLAAGAMRPGVTAGYIAGLIDSFLVEEGWVGKTRPAGFTATDRGSTSRNPLVASGDQTVLTPGTRLNIHPGQAFFRAGNYLYRLLRSTDRAAKGFPPSPGSPW